MDGITIGLLFLAVGIIAILNGQKIELKEEIKFWKRNALDLTLQNKYLLNQKKKKEKLN